MDDLLSEKEQLEQMRAWWSEYGKYVIAGVALGAAALFSFNYYQSSKRDAELAASTHYDALADYVADAKLDAAESAMGQIAADFGDSPYRVQGQLAMARLYMDQNRDQDAADTLNELLAGDSDEAFKHVARVRLSRILLYQDKADEVIELLADQPGGAFAARYAEVLGDAHVMLGHFDAARDAYQRALAEPNQAATVDRSFVQLKLLDLPIATSDDSDESADEPESGEEAE